MDQAVKHHSVARECREASFLLRTRLPPNSENAYRARQVHNILYDGYEAAVATILVTGGAGFVGSHACRRWRALDIVR
jgi:FlaA1/EpsC-like NDP-sugar epimerase